MELIVLNQEMEDHANLSTRMPQGADLMEVVTENFACLHTKTKTCLFY